VHYGGTNGNERFNRALNEQNLGQYSFELAHLLHISTAYKWNLDQDVRRRRASYSACLWDPVLVTHARMLETLVLGADVVSRTPLSTWRTLDGSKVDNSRLNGLKVTGSTINTSRSAYDMWKAWQNETLDCGDPETAIIGALRRSISLSPEVVAVDPRPFHSTIEFVVVDSLLGTGLYFKTDAAQQAAKQGEDVLLKLMHTSNVNDVIKVLDMVLAYNLAFYAHQNDRAQIGPMVPQPRVTIPGGAQIDPILFHPVALTHMKEAIEKKVQIHINKSLQRQGQGIMPVQTTNAAPAAASASTLQATAIAGAVILNAAVSMLPPNAATDPGSGRGKAAASSSDSNAAGPDVKRAKFVCPEPACGKGRHDANDEQCPFYLWFCTSQFKRTANESAISVAARKWLESKNNAE
jgi:hypothetical protein